jgi:hypothetical protein
MHGGFRRKSQTDAQNGQLFVLSAAGLLRDVFNILLVKMEDLQLSIFKLMQVHI